MTNYEYQKRWRLKNPEKYREQKRAQSKKYKEKNDKWAIDIFNKAHIKRMKTYETKKS